MRSWNFHFPIFLLLALLSLSSVKAQNDVVIYETYMSDYLPAGDYPLTVYFYNNGSETLDNLKIQWRLNNGNIQEEFIDLEAMDSQIVPSPILHAYTTEQMFSIENTGGDDQLLEVWLVDPNGESDITTSNNYDSHQIARLEDYCQRKVLLEPHLSIDSSYGPDVELVINNFKTAYPDNLLVASWHTDDGMESDQNEELKTTYDIGHTYALVDRHLFPPVYEGQTNKPVVQYEDWQDYLPLRFNRYSPVHLQTTNTFNPATRELVVDITATFLSDVGGDIRFNCYILEDPVIGDGETAAFGQLNRYSSDGPASGGEDHPYYNYPTDIMDFPHRNVVWDRLGGAWGTAGIIPGSVSKNTVIQHQYVYTVPEEYEEADLSLITIVQKHDPNTDYRDILNALDCPLNSSNQHQWITSTPPPPNTQYVLGGKVLLEGASTSSGIMSTDLKNYLPVNHPYGEAPYNYTGNETLQTDQTNVVDWVLFEARSGIPNTYGDTKGTVTVERKAGLLLADGSFADTNGQPGIKFDNLIPGQEYYFCVRHRNHLDVFTAYPTVAASNMYYDFTSSVSMALGAQQQKLNSNYQAMMLTGDYNKDGIVQVSDADVWKMNPAAVDVYDSADGNMDGSNQASDFDYWFFNKAKVGIVEIGY